MTTTINGYDAAAVRYKLVTLEGGKLHRDGDQVRMNDQGVWVDDHCDPSDPGAVTGHTFYPWHQIKRVERTLPTNGR